jgi:hypothetical protein
VDNQLRGWLEYIFFQFRNLDFSLGCKYSSALITTEVSRLPDTAHLLLPFEATPQGGVDDSIDQSGNVIVAMLQKAADHSSHECAHSQAIINNLSHRLQVTKDRINELQGEVEYFRNRSSVPKHGSNGFKERSRKNSLLHSLEHERGSACGDRP